MRQGFLIGIALGVGVVLGLQAATAQERPLVFSTNNLPPRTRPVGPALLAPPAWVQTHLRIAHLPPADWRQIGEYVRMGYQVVAVNTLAQWDRVGPQAADYPSNIVAEADRYLKRIVSLTHPAGVKAVFYLGPVQSPLQSSVFRRTHPDWLRVNEDGSRAPDFINFRHPEVARWICDQLAHLTREYGADGFWLDGYSPDALHTYDEATRRAFREFSHGADIPPRGKLNLRDPLSRLYLQWHEAYFVAFADRMRLAVRAANSNCVLYANYSANRTWYLPDYTRGEYPVGYASAVDLPSVELYWDNPGDALFQQFVYAFTQGASLDRGARVWVQPHTHGTLGTPPDVELMLRCLEGAPWGVYTEFVENTERERHSQMYVDLVKAREQWWHHSEAIPYVGLVASEDTRSLLGKEALAQSFSHTLGAFRAFFEAHLPVRVLNEEDLESARLRDLRVLVLPDVRVLSERSSEVIRRFVAAGGGLVASGGTGLFDPAFQPRTNFSLADLFQTDYLGSREAATRELGVSLWLEAPDHPILNDPAIQGQEKTAWRNPTGPPAARGWLELVAGATLVKPRAGGQTLVRLSTNESAATSFPGLIASSHGRGRVVYLPAGLDQAMFFYPNTYIRALLVNACRWVAQDATPPVEVEGPLMLAVTYRRQPAQHRTIVHLLNDQSSYGRHSLYQKFNTREHGLRGPWATREEVIPLHDLRVRCHLPGVTKATLQPENLPLALRPLPSGGVEVIVPKLEMYSMVVFE